MNLAEIITEELARAQSQGFPMAYGTLLDAVIVKRAHTGDFEFCTTLDGLCDAGLVVLLRVNRGGMWINVYQLANGKPINEDQSMSEQKNTLLARLIVLHGPLPGAALAEKARATGANIPAKNVPGLLETLVRKGEVRVRKYQSASWYMTPNQAVEWDENRVDTIGQNGNDGDHYEAHAMSAPEAEVSTKQSEGEIPVNETSTEDANLAEARRTIQSLHDSIDGMLSDWTDIRQALDVSTQEQAIAEIGNLQRLAKSIEQRAQAPGRLAMAEFDATGQIMDIEYFQPYVDAAGAQQVALNMVNDGHADRVMIIRVIGETHRPPAVFAPMVVQPMQTLREAA